ncbi:pentatricopeptide repeat-containing protein [Trifolium medium]|uniref:Pentatricopeptide repeat-containing protein n=1 Tax=Trifolium medium TaxID=97028 RepID=A0A392PG12_9FABA|nr:pentatricopeptide repeat-containing protein [Trifolium medium]
MYDLLLRGKGDRWVSSPQVEGPVVEKIIATSLISSVKEDKVVWEDESNECYSVKSGYNLAMRCIIRSDRHHVASNWNGIWKAQSPHKTRHLFWQLCTWCLPTQFRLAQRHVECELSFSVCHTEVEDAIHVFFGCVAARECWSMTAVWQVDQSIVE